MQGRPSIAFILVALVLAVGTLIYGILTQREVKEVQALSRQVESQIVEVEAKLDAARSEVAGVKSALSEELQVQRMALLARLKRASGELESLRVTNAGDERLSALAAEISELQDRISEIDRRASSQ